MSYSCIWDGFDNYDSSHEVWDSFSGTPVFSTSYARFPAVSGCVSQGVRCNAAVTMKKNLTSNQPTMIVGMGFRIPVFESSGPPQGFLAFLDSSGFQCNVGVTPAGQLIVRTGQFGTTLGSTAPATIVAGVWYWLDVDVTIGPSGSMTLYLNQLAGGPPILSLSSVNTQGSSSGNVQAIMLGDFDSNLLALDYDDFHAHDPTGGAPNAILGESRIFTKMPSGAGAQTNWTPNGASANWQCVDEVPPDDDTSYVSSNTAGAIDSYSVALAGLTLTPNAVVTRMRVRRDDAGPHTAQVGVRSSTTNAFGTAASINSSYSWVDAFFGTDPNTSSAWSAAAADAAQVAIDETS